MILEDVRAKARWLYGSDRPRLVIRALLSDATLSMVLYRGMAWSNKRVWAKPIAFLLHKINAIVCCCVIGVNARFGRRFIILHSVGIVINSSVAAGDDIVLESGVVVGAEKGKSPRLGSNIFFGSGAKVVGGLKVGSGAVVGANAVVVKDVKENSVVAGVPARLIKYK